MCYDKKAPDSHGAVCRCLPSPGPEGRGTHLTGEPGEGVTWLPGRGAEGVFPQSESCYSLGRMSGYWSGANAPTCLHAYLHGAMWQTGGRATAPRDDLKVRSILFRENMAVNTLIKEKKR